MNPAFHTLDIIIFAAYLLVIVGLGIWISHRKKNKDKTAEDYFLAGKSLPWWTIGASLIAANISAEQFIGMSGSGFAGGFAVASYEFMAALTLIIVAKFFMPVFVKQGIYTIPQFVEQRYSRQLKTILAVFWLGLFIFVNLTSVLYLGAKAIDTIIGTGDGSLIMPAIIGLGLIAALYSITGGLSSVAWTDILQVVLLVLGGLITTVVALQVISPDGTISHGIRHLTEAAGDRMHLILPKDNPEYHNLPGIAMLIGGLWVANLYYWGFNQYIIQRAFAAKSLPEAQKGLAFAAFLKLLIPFIVVIPGIVAYVMYTEGHFGAVEALTKANGALNNDNAYPWLISSFIPTGLKGLVLAALAAAIISSLASMLNSASTIYTMDIYKPLPHHRHPHRPRTRQHRTDVPIHPGIHRIGEPGHPRAVPVRTVLEENHQQRSRHRRAAFDSHRLGTQVLAHRHALHRPDVLHLSAHDGHHRDGEPVHLRE